MHAKPAPLGQKSSLARENWLRHAEVKIALSLLFVSALTTAYLLVRHTEHVMMALPFLILALIPILAAVTMGSFDRSEKQEQDEDDNDSSDD
jgi:Protein of unknown function (DUF2933)